MKKLLIAAMFVVLSLTASFGFGRIEISSRPIDSRQRDQQWMQSHRNQEIERQRREHWQREQWQREQQRRSRRHEQSTSYEWWVQHHVRDYDNQR
jgi:hypothetical protein